jgi:hypothetical protein
MNTKSLGYSVALALCTLAFASAPIHASTITYEIDLSVGTGTVVGSITTDGHIGTLADANILADDLVLTDGSYHDEFSSLPHIQGTSLTASASGLFFDFSSNINAYFGWSFLGFEDASGALSAHPSTISFNLSPCCGDPNSPMWVSESGNSQIAATPLPAALPLFATGLGALGLLGWRRKRKNAAALAA